MTSEPQDFCSAGLCQSITTSSATSDGFEPDNLLSPTGRGFLAAGFVRPPVTLTLHFCCPVALRQVRLGLRLRQQLTTGVQLLVAAPDSEAWQPVGSLWERHGQPAPEEVSFVDRAAAGRIGPPAASLRLPLTCRDRTALRRVARLRVTLSRARGPSALCLSGLRVWAVPVERGHPVLRAVMKERAARSRAADPTAEPAAAPSPPEADDTPSQSERRVEAARSARERLGPSPPEEFIDPITCEMMLLPMVLPSGHTVDQSTLERHERAEAGWGRPPGDPFSGVPFGGAARPVPDAALKTRIDHFLFEHAGSAPQLAALGRTVGRAVKRPAAPAPAPPAQRPAYDPRAVTTDAGGGGGDGGAAAGDLDSALRAALSGLTSFQPRPTPATPACRCGAHQALYSLPCEHAACRACLLRLPKAAECATCRRTFQKADAVRLHT